MREPGTSVKPNNSKLGHVNVHEKFARVTQPRRARFQILDSE